MPGQTSANWLVETWAEYLTLERATRMLSVLHFAYEAKLHNLELDTLSEQLLGYLPEGGV